MDQPGHLALRHPEWPSNGQPKDQQRYRGLEKVGRDPGSSYIRQKVDLLPQSLIAEAQLKSRSAFSEDRLYPTRKGQVDFRVVVTSQRSAGLKRPILHNLAYQTQRT